MSNFTKPNSGVLRGTAMALTDLPSIATGTALANISGSSATPTAVSLVSTATASTIMLRDTNANVQTNNLIDGYATVATAAGTTTLTVGSAYQQFFTGTTTQTVVLPVTSTLVLGQQFLVTNASSGIVTVQSSGANAIIAQPGSSSYLYTCVLTSGTTAASWYAVPYSGGGAVTPTVTVLTSGSGTFTTPSGALWIEVEMVGGGGGGQGVSGAGGTGGNTTFGTSLLVANGGTGGAVSNSGTGGSASLGTGPVGVAITGGAGGGGVGGSNATTLSGGVGGSTPFGGAGGNVLSGSGTAGITNTGAGGGGYSGTATNAAGGGGGAGGYVKAKIYNPSATYSYVIGAAGTAGSGTQTGGAGGSGVIIVTTFYNNGAVGTATNVTGVVAVANGGTGLTAPISSEIYLTAGNNFGSTNTKVQRYTNLVTNTGSDLTYTASSTLGDSITVNTTGLYAVSASDVADIATAGSNFWNITKNTITLGGTGSTDPNVLDWQSVDFTSGYSPMHMSAVTHLSSGDVLRVLVDVPSTTGGGQNNQSTNFRVTRIS